MTKKPVIHLCVLCLLISSAGLSATALPQDRDKHPLAGKWNANLSKSKRHPNHMFSSLVMEFEVSDDLIVVNYSGVNVSGNKESASTKLHPDGKEHAVAEATDVVQVTTWLTPKILENVAKKYGKTVGRSVYELSPDNKVLTATINSTDASGRPFDQIIVLDRVID